YGYGQDTDSSGRLTFGHAQHIDYTTLPSAAGSFFIAGTVGRADGSTVTSQTFQNLLDVNGDGRPDLLYGGASGSRGMSVALNRPDPANPKNSVFSTIDLPIPSASFRFVDSQTMAMPRQMDIDGSGNASQAWVRMVDMNADGRIDVVVANEKSNF